MMWCSPEELRPKKAKVQTKVYIVMGTDCGGSEIIKVFNTRESAVKFTEKGDEYLLDGYAFVSIQERDVE